MLISKGLRNSAGSNPASWSTIFKTPLWFKLFIILNERWCKWEGVSVMLQAKSVGMRYCRKRERLRGRKPSGGKGEWGCNPNRIGVSTHLILYFNVLTPENSNGLKKRTYNFFNFIPRAKLGESVCFVYKAAQLTLWKNIVIVCALNPILYNMFI